MLPPLSRTHVPATNDPDELSRVVGRMETSVARGVAPVLKRPDMDDTYIHVTLASLTTTVINHKLGRVPQEWQVLSQKGASTIYEVARDSKTLTLYSTGGIDCTVRVW